MSNAILFYDLINVAFALAILAAVQYRFRLSWWIVLALLFHFSLIFLTNGVLFPPNYMPDQFRYLKLAQWLRGVEGVVPVRSRLSVDLAGYFFGLFPLPLINSIYSIAIINFLVYLLVLVFLLEKGVLQGPNLAIFLLFPSLLLYTSVSLRDTLVLAFMCFGIWLYMRDKVYWSIVVHLPLAFLKLQNLGIYLISLLVFMLIAIFAPRSARHRVPWPIALGFLAFLAVAGPRLMRIGLDGLNLYRQVFWAEEMGQGVYKLLSSSVRISGSGALARETLRSIPYFLLKPLPWEAGNSFQLIQSAENLLVAALILYLLVKAVRDHAFTPELRFLVVLLIVALAVYGLTVWNFGTAVRYKFPYVTVFLVFFTWPSQSTAERRIRAQTPASESV